MAPLLALALALLGGTAGPVSAEASAPPCERSVECARALGYGSVCAAGRCGRYVDGRDLLEMIGLKKSLGTVEAFRLYPSFIPSVGYTPQNGFVIGFTTLAGIYLGDPRTTTISSIALVALYTSKNQIIVQSRNVAMLADNAWQLQGDYRFFITNQPTYGLGSGRPSEVGVTVGGLGTTAVVTGAQDMDFDLVRFHQAGLKRITGSLYAGAAYRLDRHFAIVDRELDLGATPPVVTSHFAYSEQFGFPKGAYTASGISAELLYDSRDSTISPYRGWYLSGSFRAYPKALGSTKDATLAQGEVRTYVGLSDDVPRNVLAFWLLGSAVTSGRLPYLSLPSIGWDFANRTGRGYVQGRFRGDAEVYAEAEWRFRLTRDGFLGGTVFANASTFARPPVDVVGFSEPRQALFHTVRPAAGAGLRFMMNREARNAVTLDFAVGQDSVGVYFGAGEAF
jgi:Omp85 superfamily domain